MIRNTVVGRLPVFDKRGYRVSPVRSEVHSIIIQGSHHPRSWVYEKGIEFNGLRTEEFIGKDYREADSSTLESVILCEPKGDSKQYIYFSQKTWIPLRKPCHIDAVSFPYTKYSPKKCAWLMASDYRLFCSILLVSRRSRIYVPV